MVRGIRVDSTNSIARELALQGAAHGTVVIADSQSEGRGRQGRKWSSPPGLNIYMSVILRPEGTPGLVSSPGLVPLWTGLSVLRAIEECSGLMTSLKWPNDILAGERKLGGILLESRSRGGRMDHAVVGIGINVNSLEDDFPGDIAQTATSIMIETGSRQDPELIISALLRELSAECGRIGGPGGTELMLREYRDRCSTIGREVSAILSDGEVRGMARGLDSSGRLLVNVRGEDVHLSSADIVHLR